MWRRLKSETQKLLIEEKDESQCVFGELPGTTNQDLWICVANNWFSDCRFID